MEEWQKQTIIKNLPELVGMTTFNIDVKTKLISNLILTPIDVELLDAESDHKGNTTASYNYFKCLMGRVGAYKILAKILEENKQMGAARILKDGMRNFGFPKELEVFNNANIDVQGKTLKLHEFFGTEKLDLVQQIFRDTVADHYDTFAKKDQTFVFANSSIPPEPHFYIPRFLSNRIEVDQSIFKPNCPDVFVFKNTISRYQLSEIVKPHSTDTSTSQLSKITCRFIYLDEFEDWDELKKSAKVPIHLINSDTRQEIYLLEDSTAALDILSKVGSTIQRIYLSEEEFVQQQLSEKVSSVCICDTPGMGKSFLLAHIARVMSKHCTGTIVVFIQLSTFVADLFLSSTNTTIEPDEVVSKVFKYVSSSHQHADLLLKLGKANLLQVEIFFDGFDEIPSDKVKYMKKVFLSIKSKLPSVRIYITSRPHMRHELEKSLGVIAYDMLPFNLQNQVNYLVQFWSPNVPELDQTLLRNYARISLEEINKTLTKDDKEMAGIPLLCRLIAEVYSNKVHFYSTTGTKNLDFPVQIAAMYQKFIELRIKACAQNEDEFKNIKLVHSWHALKLLFPTEGFHHDEMFTTFNQVVTSSEVLKAGILQLQSNTKLEFIHRTFAEYFAAEYFSEKLQTNKAADDTTKMVLSILKWLLVVFNGNNFLHSVVVNFLDFSLSKNTVSEETTFQLASFHASISSEKFLEILCSCCHHNLHSLFYVVTKAATKWNEELKNKFFTTENCFQLLSVCITLSTARMFRSCIQLLTELDLDLENICIHGRHYTLLHIAAETANYEAVEYLANSVSLELPTVLRICVEFSYYNDMDMIRKRENILHLLLNKNPTLIQESSDILFAEAIHVRLVKILVKLGANLTAVNEDGENCAMFALDYLSSRDFHELVEFLLKDCKAEFLFLNHKNCIDPLPYISKFLPESLELLLNIPDVDINMKDWKGENLLFSAVEENTLNNLKLLVNRGLDYKVKGMENRSLLHASLPGGDVEMIRYLLSLGMDPNIRDKYEETSLHYVAKHNSLSVAEVLMENGASVHAKNIDGQTPLHLAAKNNSDCRKIIMYLITKGAEVNDRDNDGNAPLHLCKNLKNKECLLEMGADIYAKNKKT